MTKPFLANRVADHRRNLLIRGAVAQQALDVRFLDREQTVTQLAIAGQPDSIAVQTKRPAYRGNKSDAADAVSETILGGGRARILIGYLQQGRNLTRQNLNNVVRQQDLTLVP